MEQREIKYTSDGKKVVVIGSLNSHEKIVQEIFVCDGSEIPSGEHFVVKSLHNAPSVSWKEKHLKEIEDHFEKRKKEFDSTLERLEKDFYSKQSELRAHIEYSGKVIKNLNPECFKNLKMFLLNEVKWVVVTAWSSPELIEWSHSKKMYEKSLRLISFMGHDDGTMTYRLHDYNDASGGNKKIFPFNNYESALEFFTKTLVESKEYTDETLNVAKKYNIVLDSEKVEKYKANKIIYLTSNYEKCLKESESFKNALSEIDLLK